MRRHKERETRGGKKMNMKMHVIVNCIIIIIFFFLSAIFSHMFIMVGCALQKSGPTQVT